MYDIVTNYYPTYVEIESTSRCNVNPPCPMCNRAFRDTDKERDLPEHVLEWSKSVIANSSSLGLHGIGEPMMAHNFLDLLEMGSLDTEVFFNTNGLIMKDEQIDAILNNRVKSIYFSVDAATEKTYAKIRGVTQSSFETVRNNITKLVKARDAKKFSLPYLSFAFVIMKENYLEIPELVYLASLLGMDGVVIWHLDKSDYKKQSRFDWVFDGEDQLNYPRGELKAVIQEGENLAKKLGIRFIYRSDHQ